MLFLKADTEINIQMGPFIDDTDGKTVETGLSITQSDVRISKNGAEWIQKDDGDTAEYEEFGWYQVKLSTTDTNAEGRLQVSIQESGALPVFAEFMVVNENVYDSLFAAATSDYLDVTVVSGCGGGSAPPTLGD